MQINPRNLVLTTLEHIEKDDAYSNMAIKEALDGHPDMDARDKALFKRLTEGCVERQIELDYIIGLNSKVKFNKIKSVIKYILRMGIYQILYMDAIPDSAACNECVKLASKRGLGNLKGFVNGILRSVTRQKGTGIPYPDKENARLDYLSVKYSFPQWIISMWDKNLGEDLTEKLLESYLNTRKVSVRVTGSGMERIRDNADFVNTDLLPMAYEGASGVVVSSSEEFKEGLVTIQDISSMLAVLCAGIHSGDTVLDVCAAPGGKTIFAAELAGNEGRVMGFDISEKKIPVMNAGKSRMHADNVKFAVGDATRINENLIEKGDVVICDVPCSGLGVIGKKRDIKYKASPDRIKDLVPVQSKILDTACQYVKPGGVLLYSTCTIVPEENELQVKNFLKNHPEFETDCLTEFVPDKLKSRLQKNGVDFGPDSYELQLLPVYGDMDGFYMARLKKKKGNDDRYKIPDNR